MTIRSLASPALLLLTVFPLLAQRDVIRTGVDLVVVPTSVRDNDKRLITGLQRDDFQILEDGRLQQIADLSIEPLPLSVAVLVDTGMGGSPLSRFANSIASLTESLADGDEAEVYRFDHIVMKISEFETNPETLEKRMAVIKTIAANRPNRATPIRILPGRKPHWLRWLLGESDPEFPHKNINDPVFAAATDLSKRPANRRRVIVIVSDGQVTDDWSPFGKASELHSFKDTVDWLGAHQIQAFGIAVGGALLEGRTSVLHSYAQVTGGDDYPAPTKGAMDSALSQIMVQARHQYVLSYVSNNEINGLLPVSRRIEVKVNRDGLRVNHRRSYAVSPTEVVQRPIRKKLNGSAHCLINRQSVRCAEGRNLQRCVCAGPWHRLCSNHEIRRSHYRR